MMSRMRRIVAALGLVVIAVPAFAQGAKAPPKPVAKPVASKEPRIMALARGIYRLTSLGDSAVLTARIFGDNFKIIANETIVWRSEDGAIAEAAPSGAVTAIGNGTTKVWAVAGKDSVFAVVMVEQRAAKLGFTPTTLVLNALGAVVPVRAEQRDARGNPLRGDYAINAACRMRDNGVVAALHPGGRIVARQPGATALVCMRAGLRDSLPIVVRQEVFAAKIAPSENVNLAQAGDTLRLRATAFDRLAKPIVDIRALWSAVDTAIVDVDQVNGIVLGKAQGEGRVAARIEGLTDTVTVHVLGPLPEGKTLMRLVASRPTAPAPSAPAPVAATPVSATSTSMGGGGAGMLNSIPAASSPASVVTRGGRAPAPAASRASSRGAAMPTGLNLLTVANAAADSAAINTILTGGVQTTNARVGRTYVITPMVMLTEYRYIAPTLPNDVSQVTPGTLTGIEAEVSITNSFFARGHYLTGALSATALSASSQYNVDKIGDVAIDLGYRALPWLAFTAGYGVRGVTRVVPSGSDAWTIIRVGALTDLSMFSDRVHANIGLNFMPRVSLSGGDSPGTAMGGLAGVSYRAGWFTAGVEYMVDSFEFSKRPADAAQNRAVADFSQRQDRLSALRIKLGVHFGR